MQVAVGYCDHPDSAPAGRQAVRQALEAAGRSDTCDLVLLFGTARHDQETLRRAVAEVSGNPRYIFGGGAAGVITNDQFGYAGDQVGVACIWLDNSSVHVVREGGLSAGEFEAGIRLGEKLAQAAVAPDSPVLLFYDAVNRSPGKSRLVMATWLLEGIEKQLGFLPDIMGAGLLGDHILTPTRQFLGPVVGEDHAFAFTFSRDIHIDNVILHGCHPGSPYYTVTKADGSTILEIEGTPAISFLDGLLGSAIKPEEYPFFLILGINHGAVDAEYDPENYASRLCQGIDKDRGGIIMFEPDMVAGTRFQVMYRTLGLDYVQPQVEGLLDRLATEGKEPFFAVFIDCAGRCAGYGGTDLEDACVLQDLVGNRFPLFGIYTGVEIAPLGGKPRSLDWTGVFCVFSKRKDVRNVKRAVRPHRVWGAEADTAEQRKTLSPAQVEKLAVQNMAKILALDAQSIVIRNELEQRRRGFRLLAELSVSLREFEDRGSIFYTATRRINASLNMQKTVLLVPDATGTFTPSVLQGFTAGETAVLARMGFGADVGLLDVTETVLVTGEHDEDFMGDLRRILNLPYFIAAPVVVRNKLSGILITGRMVEAPPFLCRLSRNEAETVQAVAALLASTMVYKKLDEAHRRASLDPLTELYNRGALEQQVTALLEGDLAEDAKVAFILADLDYLKEINDQYGHIAGDRVLKMLARTLRFTFRFTDIVARLGGDEFVVFCMSPRGVASIEPRVAKLVDDWRRLPHYTEDGRVFYATLSIGLVVAPGRGATFKELLRRADIALYQTKQNGRNGYTVYDENTMHGRQPS